MTTPSSADLRQYLMAAYSDEELTTFCSDYFRDVYDNFTTGMTKAQKVQLLLDRCERRDATPDLLAALERDRPEQYRKRFGAAMVERARPPKETKPRRPKPPPRMEKGLRARLTAPDPATRAEAARALGRLAVADAETIAELLRLYPADPDDAPRHAALAALLALGRAADVGMVLVPAGEFLMGSADDDREAGSDEKPQRKVYLPTYALDRTPVTNAQYRQFIEAGGYGNSAYWQEALAAGRWRDGSYIDYDGKPRSQPFYWKDAKWKGEQQPMVGVTWYEALAYTHWAGKRLPTEAEWEKAASWTGVRSQGSGIRGQEPGGRQLRYPWGDEWDPKRCNTRESRIGKTTSVDAHSPAGDSPYGMADMAGNVSEWCSTRWGSRYPYDPDDGREDLGGGDDVSRVLRGGSWYTEKKAWVRCACRDGANPWNRSNTTGFRCCFSTSSLVGGSGS